jgi:hypothetical protein
LSGIPLGLLDQLISARCLYSPESLPSVLRGLVAQLDVHTAVNIDRDSRIRCISILPEVTVEACEYRQWPSTAKRNCLASALVEGVA